MPTFVTDALWLTAATVIVTAAIVVTTRLCFRRGKGLEEP
jgi:hypothetical protein